MKKITSIFCLFAITLAVLTSCASHEHQFATDAWAKDADYHWRACTVEDGCPEKSEKAEHTFDVIVNSDGTVMNECTVCGESNDKVSTAPEHEHTYAETLSNNENFHWYACTVENCYEMLNRLEHVYGNPEVSYADRKMVIKSVCIDCGYESVTEQVINSEIDDAISWNEMFKNFKLTNFSMTVFFNDGDTNHCVVTDNAAYYRLSDVKEFYTVRNTDGTCTTYERDRSSGGFRKSSDTSDAYLVGAQTETVIQISFEDNFDKFRYDEKTGSYVCEEVIEAIGYDFNGDPIDIIFCYNNVINIVDGKISSISASYYFEDGDINDPDNYFFKYYNIGTSVVEIPRSVINDAAENN